MTVAISIVTASYNSEKTIRHTLESVARQAHADVQHIVADGGSTDGTLDIVREFPKTLLFSEPDRGIYDGMNKGIARATGDVVGILNSDDFYPNAHVLTGVADAFADPKVDATIGDIAFVDPQQLHRVTRYYSARSWHPGQFELGLMPPHPAFFARRQLFDQLGVYNADYKIAGDFELLVRFLRVAQVTYRYIPGAHVHMRPGGMSNESLANRYAMNVEVVRACRDNGLSTNMFKVCLKYLYKAGQFLPGLPVVGRMRAIGDKFAAPQR